MATDAGPLFAQVHRYTSARSRWERLKNEDDGDDGRTRLTNSLLGYEGGGLLVVVVEEEILAFLAFEVAWSNSASAESLCLEATTLASMVSWSFLAKARLLGSSMTFWKLAWDKASASLNN